MRRCIWVFLGMFLLVIGIDYGTNVEFGAWYWSLVIGAGFGIAVAGLSDDR